MKTTAYRIEYLAQDGLTYGPYSASFTEKELERVCERFRNECNYFPEPDEDNIKVRVQRYHIFGVNYITYLFDMAPRWTLQALLDSGFVISEYEVTTEVDCVGNKQVMWARGKEKFIRHLTLEGCFDIMDDELNQVHFG